MVIYSCIGLVLLATIFKALRIGHLNALNIVMVSMLVANLAYIGVRYTNYHLDLTLREMFLHPS